MPRPQSYRMPTMAWADSAFDSQYLPNHSHIKRFSMTLTAQYDEDAAVGRTREGFLDQIISTLAVRRGGTTFFKFRGMDWHFIHQLMQKEPHGLTQIDATGGLANQTVGSPVQLGIDIPIPAVADQDRAVLEIQWLNGAALSANAGDYTLDFAALNGQYIFDQATPPALRLLPFKALNNQSGLGIQADIPVEGQILGVLCIARANASPFAVRNPAVPTNLVVRVEGDTVYDMDWRAAQASYKEFCNLPAVQTGVGLLILEGLPLVRGSSEIVIDQGDATATDWNLYGVYTAGADIVRQRDTTQDIVRASGASPVVARGTLAVQPQIKRVGSGPVPIRRL